MCLCALCFWGCSAEWFELCVVLCLSVFVRVVVYVVVCCGCKSLCVVWPGSFCVVLVLVCWCVALFKNACVCFVCDLLCGVV